MQFFKRKTIGYYFGLLSSIFLIILLVVGLSAPGFAHETFPLSITILIIISLISEVVIFFLDYDFLSLLPVAINSALIGLCFYYGMPIVMDMINKINFMDGNWDSVKIYLIMIVLACVLSIVPCFTGIRKEVKYE